MSLINLGRKWKDPPYRRVFGTGGTDIKDAPVMEAALAIYTPLDGTPRDILRLLQAGNATTSAVQFVTAESLTLILLSRLNYKGLSRIPLLFDGTDRSRALYPQPWLGARYERQLVRPSV